MTTHTDCIVSLRPHNNGVQAIRTKEIDRRGGSAVFTSVKTSMNEATTSGGRCAGGSMKPATPLVLETGLGEQQISIQRRGHKDTMIDAARGLREGNTHNVVASTKGASTTRSPIAPPPLCTRAAVEAATSFPNDPSNGVMESNWERMFTKLEEYKEQFGNTLVPNRYPADVSLGLWVSTQRRNYKSIQTEKAQSSTMIRNRIRRLESIGFVWKATNPRHVSWEHRFQELVAFKETYGHAQVPIGYEKNVKLANWVSTQRQEAKLGREGRSSRLNQERIDMLNSVGFVWEAQRGGGRKILVRVAKKEQQQVGRRIALSPRFPADAAADKNYDSSDEEAVSPECQSRNGQAPGRTPQEEQPKARFGVRASSAAATGRDLVPQQRSPDIEQLLLPRPAPSSTSRHRSGSSNGTVSSLVAHLPASRPESRATTRSTDLVVAAASSPHTNLPFGASAGALSLLGSDFASSHLVQQPNLPNLDDPLTPEEKRLYHYLLELEHERGVVRAAEEGTWRRRHRLRQLLALGGGHIDTSCGSSPYVSLGGGGAPILSSSSNLGLVAAARPSTRGDPASAASVYYPTNSTPLSPRSSSVFGSTSGNLPSSNSMSLIIGSSLAQQRLLLRSQQEQELLRGSIIMASSFLDSNSTLVRPGAGATLL
uniref:Helicase-associated domain-containing protein n=1 Tax=Grammatophora oceanica TaxID=210454 RepID=A0A7S1VGB4_9STRA